MDTNLSCNQFLQLINKSHRNRNAASTPLLNKKNNKDIYNPKCAISIIDFKRFNKNLIKKKHQAIKKKENYF